MSFNTHDNKASLISPNNYEEYFLLYVDNELNAEERMAVENFLVAHPDLQAEMDIFLSTKLPAENNRLEGKESLMAHSMSFHTIDQSLLLYIDGELDKTAKEKVEGRLKIDQAFQLQHQALLQTKLDAAEIISYPDKKELYRHTTRRLIPFWMRIAAAAILVLSMGALVVVHQKDTPPVAAGKPVSTQLAHPVQQQPVGEPVSTAAVAEKKINIVSGNKDKENISLKERSEKTGIEGLAKREMPGQTNAPDPVVKNAVYEDGPRVEEASHHIAAADPIRLPKQTINNPVVTSVSADPLNPINVSPKTTEQRDFIAGVDNEKKASLKGFLRKATRFIERRTNIKTTNENDELLIGAVALKL